MCTKFYQNRLGFVEDMTKTFWCVFRFTVYIKVTDTVITLLYIKLEQ